MTNPQTAAFATPSGRIVDGSSSYGRRRSAGWADSVGGQWGAMAAGAVAGVATGVLMATLGAAVGLTVTASAADSARESMTSLEGAGQAAVGFGIGAGIWLVISAAVVGVVGGSLLAKVSHAGRAYYPAAHGTLTWALGVTMALLFAASGSGVVSTALGVGAAGAVGTAVGAPSRDRNAPVMATEDASSGTRATEQANGRGAEPVGAGFERSASDLTAAQREAATRAAEVAATAAATAAWFTLVALLIGLASTVGAASQRKLQPDPELGLNPA